MSFILRSRSAIGSRHVHPVLSAYADRTLPAAALLACDRHVAICPRCQCAVEGERRLLSSLRTAATPRLPSRLESALLELDLAAGPAAGPAAVPAAPAGLPHRRLVVVGRSAPAMHRSPVRAAMLASLAAGASAAAAWSMGISGVSASPASQGLRVAAPASNARQFSGTASNSHLAPFLSTQPASTTGSVMSTGLTAYAIAGSAVPVGGPWAGLSQVTALGTIKP